MYLGKSHSVLLWSFSTEDAFVYEFAFLCSKGSWQPGDSPSVFCLLGIMSRNRTVRINETSTREESIHGPIGRSPSRKGH